MRFIPLARVPDVIRRLQSLAGGPDRTRQRDALACLLGLHGLRCGEVTHAKLSHLHVTERELHIPSFKNSKPREVPLHESLIDALLCWRSNADIPDNSDWLLATCTGKAVFESHLQRFAKKITKEVLGEGLRFHAFRHTFAMRTLEKTRDMSLVQRLLGHRSINSTQIYAQSLASLPEDLRISL